MRTGSDVGLNGLGGTVARRGAQPTTDGLVLHVIPADLARGAQTRAREMRDALDGETSRHRVLSIFETTDAAGLADHSIGADARSRSHFISIAALRSLRKHFAAEQPSVVVAYGSESLRYAALARRGSTQLVYSKTGVIEENLSRTRLRYHGWLARHADHVAAVSSETAEEAAAILHVPRERITMVSNGRDPSKFTPGRPPEQPRPRLLWVGHVTATKRPDLFLEVVAELRSRDLDFAATLVGDGPELERLRPRARAAGVELLGRRVDVDVVMRSADIFVFTGERSGEGLPGVLIEASLCALPIVTTDVPGARDVVIHDLTGYVVNRTAAAVAHRVASLVEDEQLRQDMGQHGRHRSKDLFTVASSAARWKALLNDLLATDA